MAAALKLSEISVLERACKIVLAQQCFYDYCRVQSPDFYTENRVHLRDLCFVLEDLYFGRLRHPETGKIVRKLIIELPPQTGKSRTLTHFCQWVFGQNPEERVITGAYNDDTATDFSTYTRDGISEEKLIEEDIVYSDIFPGVEISRTSGSKKKWALAGQHFNYLGAGLGGSLTSKGGTILIGDDFVKGSEEAFNQVHLEKVWNRYTSTYLSRVSAKGGEPIEILCATPWAKLDPTGRILDGPHAKKWFVFRRPAKDPETGKMLDPTLLSEERYNYLKSLMVEEIFLANYDLQRVDVKGVLYQALKTYAEKPSQFSQIGAYVDTADEGGDYLCAVIYGVSGPYFYVLDVFYTQEGAEVTEIELAEMLARNGAGSADIESNNGGRYFARNVEREFTEKFSDKRCHFQWFHQSKNKMARILSQSRNVQNYIIFPEGWRDRWPTFYSDVTQFNKSGKNLHDDAPDVLTGIIERSSAGISFD